jgi:tRNA-specific 2-thiouridylase
MSRFRKKTVAVAMSGGVDSSVAAALLLEAGYDVVGVTMNLFSLPREICRSDELRSCCGFRAVEDAHQVACRLGISHFVVDLRAEFERRVVDDFCREYSRGRTPNPCIRCNERIKFKLLLERVRRLGSNFLATGHHARVRYRKETGRFLLKKGRDRAKDQSYFLYPLSQAQLSRTLFPVGGLTKDAVRALGRKWNLPVADKPESQEVCFVPGGRYPEFLKGRVPRAFTPGPIKDLDGRVLGQHKGIGNFTVGQRRGMGLAAAHPLYVVSIRAKDNTVVVGNNRDLYQKALLAGRVKFIALDSLDTPLRVRVKIRYKHEAARAVLTPFSDGRVLVEFEKAQRAITPGQSVVFYHRDVVVGGGIIVRALE